MKVEFTVTALSVLLVIGATASNAQPKTDRTYNCLNTLEKERFGVTHATESVSQRVESLELNAFGSVQSGTVKKRLNALLYASIRNRSASTKSTPTTPARNIDLSAYTAEFQRRVQQAWNPQGHEDKRVVVVFKLHSDGTMSHLRLDHSSGLAIADQAALKAIENSCPFQPLPVGAEDEIDVQVGFNNHVSCHFNQ